MIHPKVNTKVTGQDRVNKLMEMLKKYKTAYVTVGIHEKAGSYTKGESPPMVVQVALWNEFGTEKSPARPFFSTAIDSNEEKINQWRDEAVDKVLAGTFTIEKALDYIGFRVQVLIQNQIKSNMPPPNAPSTLKAKARAGVAPQTLINTGLMLRSVTFERHLE